MSNFHRPANLLAAMSTEGMATPVKPLARGEFAAAAIVRTGAADGGLRLHRQPNHEELLVVIEGEGEFRVADEVRHIKPGDFVFMPRNAVHGTVSTEGGPIALLSILTPQFDLSKDVVWENGAEAPRYEMV